MKQAPPPSRILRMRRQESGEHMAQERESGVLSASAAGVVRMVALGLVTLAVTLAVVYAAGLPALRLFTGFEIYGSYYRFPLSLRNFILLSDSFSPYILASISAYLYTARRLASTTWTRALVEACALMAPLAACYIAAAETYTYGFGQPPVTAGVWLFVELAIAALIGALFARWSARWAAVRGRGASRARFPWLYTFTLVVVAAAVMNWATLLTSFLDRWDSQNTIILADGAATLALLVIGSALTAAWINHDRARLGTPSPALAPTTPPTV